MKRTKVYVAGPITKGDQFKNVAGAIHVADMLFREGLVPFCPHAMTAQWHMMHPKSHAEWMGYDLAWVEACDALLRIPGDSVGADMEVEHAGKAGIPVFYDTDELLTWAAGRGAAS